MRPRFHGTARAMFPLVLKGLFLTVVTLGLYRFWYQTEVRRFLWNNTEVDGDLLEYTGRGVELFIGFLIALAVLIPAYGAIFLIATLAGPIAGLVVQFVATLGIVVLAQYALYRARRYRLTRTIWRGVRFQQTGSGWTYAWRSIAWALLTLLTLGLALPFMRASLERYKLSHTWYGDQQGAFSATGGQLFKRGILLWLVAVALIFGPIAIIVVYGTLDPDPTGPGFSAAHWIINLTIFGVAVLVPLYLAIEFRWWANGCSVGPATARCDLGLFAFLKVYLAYAGIALLFFIVAGLVAAVVGYAFYAAGLLGDGAEPPLAAIILAVMAYFIAALIFAALWQLFGVRPIWRKSFESVAIAGLGALTAAQSGEPPANAFGEGVADALDFGGF
ncbi:YjgN family protein [Methylopila turkensis]|uniref:YjgN family protein n=1 Tax=Methylopila turkensis TaxID=1437816 RepID=UPI0022F2B12D|nr:DUF898 family protein [Methylopila turkensis]